MKKIISLFIAASLLVGCGGNDNKDDNKKASFKITEDSYVVQMVASDYGSSQVAIGNILGDRTATQELLISDKSDYVISTYKNSLYHIGRYEVDAIDKYNTTKGVTAAEWSYSTNYNTEGSANTYKLVQQTETNGYLINYGSTKVLQVNPSASTYEGFVKAEIDLSEYNVESTSVPNMSDAVILNNHLYVAMQRLDDKWTPNQAYIAVIDLDTNEEVDTDTQQDGLKGIPLNATNTSTIVEYNGQIYASGGGKYGSITGGLDMINTDTFEVTSLIDETVFSNLNITTENVFYHVVDVEVVSDTNAYAIIDFGENYKTRESIIISFNPTDKTFEKLKNASYLDDKLISDINVDANDRLWLGISNADNPGIYVLDTDINTINGDFIKLDMPVGQIEFLTVQ